MQEDGVKPADSRLPRAYEMVGEARVPYENPTDVA